MCFLARSLACSQFGNTVSASFQPGLEALDTRSGAPSSLPLYVDLDGSLTYADLLFESFLLLVRQNPLYILSCLVWLMHGKARLKAEIARRVEVDVTVLPYNEPLLAFLREERARGRRIVLASASNHLLVRQVAEHLDLFDGWLGSDERDNLKAQAKLKAIRAQVGEGGFAYAGNGDVDLVIWAEADEVIVVNARSGVAEKAGLLKKPALVIDPPARGLRLYAKALRLHQWAKNALLFVPLLAAHTRDPNQWLAVLVAFVAFGLCASSTYIINDLLDLPSDRQHPRKRFRPFASGLLGIPVGFALVALCLPLSLILASLVSPLFLGMVVFYSVLTLGYSMVLKRVTFVDVLVLAFLYTYRVLAGGVAADIVVSNWLLAVSMFMFLSLAFVKRCAELEGMSQSGRTEMAGRGYRPTDLPYLMAMGISSGFMATMVLALYIDSQAGGAMYPRAEFLWLMLPVLLYWIMRLWLKTARMEIHDDPLQFALTDPPSWVSGLLIGAIAVVASFGGAP